MSGVTPNDCPLIDTRAPVGLELTAKAPRNTVLRGRAAGRCSVRVRGPVALTNSREWRWHPCAGRVRKLRSVGGKGWPFPTFLNP